MKRRVVVTGMVLFHPSATPLPSCGRASHGKQVRHRCDHAFDTAEYKGQARGRVKDLDMEQYFSKRELKIQ